MTALPNIPGVIRQEAISIAEGRSGARCKTGLLVRTLALVCIALAIPAQAFGHAGEVHVPEPPPAREASKPTPATSGKEASVSKAGGGEAVEEQEAVTVASEVPPPPTQPDSNPAIHFIALAAVAALGAGLLLIRSRRSAV